MEVGGWRLERVEVKERTRRRDGEARGGGGGDYSLNQVGMAGPVALIHRGRLEIHDSRHPSPLLLAQIPRSPVEAVLVARGTDAVTPGVAISRSFCCFWAAERCEARGTRARLCSVAHGRLTRLPSQVPLRSRLPSSPSCHYTCKENECPGPVQNWIFWRQVVAGTLGIFQLAITENWCTPPAELHHVISPPSSRYDPSFHRW